MEPIPISTMGIGAWGSFKVFWSHGPDTTGLQEEYVRKTEVGGGGGGWTGGAVSAEVSEILSHVLSLNYPTDGGGGGQHSSVS